LDAVSENLILTPEQKIFLARFAASELRDSYYLTGGTALAAFHLRHRYSDDLDLFTEDEVSIEPVMAFVRGLPGFRQVSFQHKFDRRIFLLDFERAASLKVEFTRYPFRVSNREQWLAASLSIACGTFSPTNLQR